MKKCMSMVLVVCLLLSCVLIGVPPAQAAKKDNVTRAISIVFDNSGSMYTGGKQSWCRATYATEVFASMLNEGDILQIYPMNPINIGDKEYSMDAPLKITKADQAKQIRDIVTPKAGDTHIESIDRAIAGAKAAKADEKYVIVLSDGEEFYRDKKPLGGKSKGQLDAYFKTASKDVKMMYLGIDPIAIIPDTPQSDVFTKKHAKNSTEVLSALTDMCNRIFGRDTLPKSRISGNSVEFDVSMSKLIVFVQGENIADLKLVDGSGKLVGNEVGKQQTKYSTGGCTAYKVNNPDTSLQGMMVTYTDCAAGTYTLSYAGTATSTEVYYEPNADLDFVFTDAAGNNVDPQMLYEGEYKVSFGMKDAKTGKLSNSDLLGKTKYQGYYSINGEQYPITSDSLSGEVPVSLKMGDSFDAQLTVTYLSGYTITKDSTDFGWPEGGIKVAARPAGDLVLEITGGDGEYSLQDLEEGAPYIAKIYYQGTQLTGAALESVTLEWNPDVSNVEIRKEFAEDHYKLHLLYKNPEAPQDTKCGECTVPLFATYQAEGSDPAATQTSLTYNIKDDFSPLKMDLVISEDYIVISKLEETPAFRVNLQLNGAPLPAEEFAAVELKVDCGGINYTLTPLPDESAYTIKLKNTDGIEQGDYNIKVTGYYTDHIGRVTQTDAEGAVTLSTLPLWVKVVACLLALLLLILLILLILHIRVLPKHCHVNKKECSMIFDGENVNKGASFDAKISGGQLTIYNQYGGAKTVITMDVRPGKESYLKKKQIRRSAEVKSDSVKKLGSGTIYDVSIGSVKYILNEDNGKLVRTQKTDKPYLVKHGMPIRYSGTITKAGIPRSFSVSMKLDFKKKK